MVYGKPPISKPFSTTGCISNSTFTSLNTTIAATFNSTNSTTTMQNEPASYLIIFQLSYLWYSLFSVVNSINHRICIEFDHGSYETKRFRHKLIH